MSTFNNSTIGPMPPFPEVGRVDVDVQLAQNTRRQGPRQAEEGLGFKGAYSAPFYASVYDADSGASHRDVEVQPASQANGRGLLGSGEAVPSWDAVDGATRAGFWQGTDATEQSVTARPFPFEGRRGASQPLAPTFGLNAGSRAGNVYCKTVPPDNGGRGHVNAANVTSY